MPVDRNVTNTKIRQMTVDGINRRGRLMSPEEAARITDVLSRSAHRVPLFVHSFISGNVSSEEINRIMDQIFVDHSILMRDLEILEDGIRQLYNLIRQRYVQPRIQMKSTITSIKNFIKLRAYESKFNVVDIKSMAAAENKTSDRFPLVTDSAVGVLRLDTFDEKVYNSEAELDISLDLVTSGAYVYEVSDFHTLFDPHLIYYMNVYTKKPRNDEPWHEYDGVVAALSIRLPAIIPVNTLKIRLISDVRQQILGLSYSRTSEGTDSDIVINDLRIVNNGIVTEMEFDTVSARKLTLYIGSTIFEEITAEHIISGGIHHEPIKRLLHELQTIQLEKMSTPTVEEVDIESRLQKSLKLPDIVLPPGMRLYTVPIRSIEVSNRKYRAFGTYLSDTKKLEGNLAHIAFESEQVSHPAALVVTKAVINTKEYTIADKADDGSVVDVAAVVLDDLDDEDKRYKFTTNLIPDEETRELTDHLEIRLGDTLMDNSSFNLDDRVVTPNGIQVHIKPDAGLSEGAILNMKFFPSPIDRTGAEYDPRFVDIIRTIGKPNVRDSIFANRRSNFIYFYDLDENLSIYSINDVTTTEEAEIYIGNDVLNGEDLTGSSKPAVNQYSDLPDPTSVDDGTLRNVDADETIDQTTYSAGLYISNLTDETWTIYAIAEELQGDTKTYYKLLTEYYGPYDGGYVFIEEEVGVDPGTYQIVLTEPYVLGMAVIYQDGAGIDIDAEYAIRTGPRESFRTIKLKSDGGLNTDDKVQVVYMPVPKSNSAFDDLTKSNIQRHNITENHRLESPTTNLRLNRYPYIDLDITSSGRFIENRGIYYFKGSESILYEPFVIYKDAVKLEKEKDYTVNGREVIFSEAVSGNVVVRYYVLADNLTYKIDMYRLDPTRTDTSPKVLHILGLTKVVK